MIHGVWWHFSVYSKFRNKFWWCIENVWISWRYWTVKQFLQVHSFQIEFQTFLSFSRIPIFPSSTFSELYWYRQTLVDFGVISTILMLSYRIFSFSSFFVRYHLLLILLITIVDQKWQTYSFYFHLLFLIFSFSSSCLFVIFHVILIFFKQCFSSVLLLQCLWPISQKSFSLQWKICWFLIVTRIFAGPPGKTIILFKFKDRCRQ